MYIKDGTKISETFVTDFLTTIEHNVRMAEDVEYELNVQDGINISLQRYACYASEYLAFVDALKDEINKHGIALVNVVWLGDASSERTEYTTIVVED